MEEVKYKEVVQRISKLLDIGIPNFDIWDISTMLAVIFNKENETTMDDLIKARQQ